MEKDYRRIWEVYAQSWKIENTAERIKSFEKALSADCVYSDPFVMTKGWDELISYMDDFHKQIPGGWFETTQFLTHHHKSIAQWNMKNSDGQIMGSGISYGEYDDSGKLTAMFGFYALPPSQ